ncbi:hypothetical protein [Leucobacter sp. cx-169]|uniref:hypothetical protein n=1 Tax=Leucobacter sp. cx-169 TaxID=2770549 RepID=UPI00165D6444|nr:hypothetical protein [Leucobacter sp. cx-169]MBC9927378.1 hypothetical protein [Leucobacter sp. cx-169]
MITRSYATFSSSNADDLAFLALKDVSKITEDLEDTRVVGGLMVMLLSEAYPANGYIPRRTSDVDTAISVQIANAGTLHERLLEAGYESKSGNRYFRGERVVDLLIPSSTDKFTSAQHGGRGFDSAPGLSLALAGQPITHQLNITLVDGSTMELEVRTPSVEHATILKAFATQSRSAPKDLVDLHNLLLIADTYSHEEIGGWRLTEADLTGARGDATRVMQGIRTSPGLRHMLRDTGVTPPVLSQLLMRHSTVRSERTESQVTLIGRSAAVREKDVIVAGSTNGGRFAAYRRSAPQAPPAD